MTHPWVIGCDIGGTSVKFAKVDQDGAMGEMDRVTVTPADKSPEGIIRLLVGVVDRCRQRYGAEGFRGMGIGVAGVIDQPEGLMRQSPNFPLWIDFPFKRLLTQALGGAAVELENDVNAIALGEHWVGAARDERNVVVMAIGTGFGGALILNGALWQGMHGMAGEIGHMNIVSRDGRPCGCGSQGCVEAYVSQVGLAVTLREHPDADFRARFAAFPTADWPRRLSELAEEGDERALAVFHDWGRHLGVLCGSLANLLDIELFLIGGGVGRALPHMQVVIEKTLMQHSFRAIGQRVRVRPFVLGDAAGILGAASLALGSAGVRMA